MASGLVDKPEVVPSGEQDVTVFQNLLQGAIDPSRQWEPFRPGVEISLLYSVPGGLASGFLRFAPGAKLPRHCHAAHEHIFVLQGSQQDENGIHRAGTMLLHSPDTCHTVSSPEGCLVLAIWGKPVIFQEP